MRKTLNYTGRKKIPRDRIEISLRDDVNGERRFDATIRDLCDLVPSDARVLLIPNVGSSSMRFDFGQAGQIKPPADRTLSEIDRGERVLFRLIAVDDRQGNGRILAAADRLTAGNRSDTREWLLPLRTEDLGQALWRVALERGAPPELLVSSRVPGLAERIAHDPLLVGAVLPEALRQVLTFMAANAEWEAEHGERWRAFIVDLVGEDAAEQLESGESVEEIVQQAVQVFTRRHRFAELAATRLQERPDA